MLDIIWSFMIFGSIIYGFFCGNISKLTNALTESTREAVSLCITLVGIVAFWCGIMEIASESGLIKKLQNKMSPIIKFLFPDIPNSHKSLEYISINFVSNILGLGWAATPAGLNAMSELKKLQIERGDEPKKAGKEMCTFLILNISSLQLIPVNIIAYRSEYGSYSPAAVTGPAIFATFISTFTAVIFCCFIRKRI